MKPDGRLDRPPATSSSPPASCANHLPPHRGAWLNDRLEENNCFNQWWKISMRQMAKEHHKCIFHFNHAMHVHLCFYYLLIFQAHLGSAGGLFLLGIWCGGVNVAPCSLWGDQSGFDLNLIWLKWHNFPQDQEGISDPEYFAQSGSKKVYINITDKNVSVQVEATTTVGLLEPSINISIRQFCAQSTNHQRCKENVSYWIAQGTTRCDLAFYY